MLVYLSFPLLSVRNSYIPKTLNHHSYKTEITDSTSFKTKLTKIYLKTDEVPAFEKLQIHVINKTNFFNIKKTLKIIKLETTNGVVPD